MSQTLLEQFIKEFMMTQNIIKIDKRKGRKRQPVVRKLVTFVKPPTSRFRAGDNVDIHLDDDGDAIIDDVESWTAPDDINSPLRHRT